MKFWSFSLGNGAVDACGSAGSAATGVAKGRGTARADAKGESVLPLLAPRLGWSLVAIATE